MMLRITDDEFEELSLSVRDYLPDTGPCAICGTGLPASHRTSDSIVMSILNALGLGVADD